MMCKKIALMFVLVAVGLGACQASAGGPQPGGQTPVAVELQNGFGQPAATHPAAAPLEVFPEVVPGAQPAGTRAPISAYPSNPPVPPPAGAGPLDNQFQSYGYNPYVDTREDQLSSFGLDVDTASYAVARRYLMDGLKPPPEAIRVEEFVNYLDAGYPARSDVAFGIYADGAPSPLHNDGTHILRFGIQGYQVPEFARKPVSLTFVIDVSGSMEREQRLELVKQSLQLLVDRLRPEDTVGIVVYGSEAHVVLYPTRGSDRGAILQAVYALRPEGSTNAEAGIRLGYQMAASTLRPGATSRVILCSDGVANVGAIHPDALVELIRQHRSSGITLTSIGVGMGNFNDVLMEQLADHGNGNYAYVDTLEEARKVFVDDLTSTLQVIAFDARVQVDFNPAVVSHYRLLGYENRAMADPDFRNDAVDAGEIGAGHTVSALYAVRLHPAAEGRIATVQLRWRDPESGEVREINGNFNSWDMAGEFGQTSRHYQLAMLSAHFAEMLRRSPWAAGIYPYQIENLADRLAALFPADPDVAELLFLIRRAVSIGALS